VGLDRDLIKHLLWVDSSRSPSRADVVFAPRAAIPPPTIKPPGSTLSGRKGLTAYDPLRALLAPLLNRPEAGLGDIPESKHHSARVGMFGLCGVGTNDTQRQTATSCEVAIFGTRVGACRWIIAH
jgi:hypothetical protein